jgi:hypothetical protein
MPLEAPLATSAGDHMLGFADDKPASRPHGALT